MTEEGVEEAGASLTGFMQLRDLKGRTFLDVGCGSGLFSLAAFRLKAERVVSFDQDPLAVECCRQLRKESGNPFIWQVEDGSILDGRFLSKLGKFDVVYAWGVLHHTGNMWRAVANSARLVRVDGLLYMALYNRVPGVLGSEFWLRVKRLYNSSSAIGQATLEVLYLIAHFTISLGKDRSATNESRRIGARGMFWRTDITDWLGGYPYEFASSIEVLEYMQVNFPNFELTNVMQAKGLANNWYLFKRVY